MVQGIRASQQIYANPKDTYFAPKALKENNKKAHAHNATSMKVALITLAIFSAAAGVALLIAGAVIPNPIMLLVGIGILAGIVVSGACWLVRLHRL